MEIILTILVIFPICFFICYQIISEKIGPRKRIKEIKKEIRANELNNKNNNESEIIGLCITNEDPFEKEVNLIIDAKQVNEQLYVQYVYAKIENNVICDVSKNRHSIKLTKYNKTTIFNFKY